MNPRQTFGRMLATLSSYLILNRTCGKPYHDFYKCLRIATAGRIPQILYKYYSNETFERDRTDLLRRVIHLSTPTSFNDAYDVLPVFNHEQIRKRLHKQITESNMRDTLHFQSIFLPKTAALATSFFWNNVDNCGGFENWKRTHIEETLNRLPRRAEEIRAYPRCTCLTESNSSSYMWGNYANQSKGYCVGYEIPIGCPRCACEHCSGRRRCKHDKFPTTLVPVQYEGRPDITGFSDVLGGSQFFLPYYSEHFYACIINLTAYKSKEWEHEKEWRYVTTSCKCVHNGEMYLSLKPVELYIGSQASQSQRRQLETIARNLDIRLFQEELSYDADRADMQFNRIL